VSEVLRRVLVVDDDPAIRRAILAAVRSEGYAVMEAGTGHEALEQAARRLPDLIILDVMLPDLSGLDVLDALDGDADMRTIPVILCTASSDHVRPASKRLETRLGMVLRKPFDLDDLLDAVNALIDGSAPHSDAALVHAPTPPCTSRG